MITLYTDASFNWTNTDKTSENFVRGKIAVVGEGIKIIESVVIGKVPTLKQYTNILELIAIARAIEIASQKHFNEPLHINTDSQVARTWAMKGIKQSLMTEAHRNAIEYLSKAKQMYSPNEIIINYVPREHNLAGNLLEEELKNSKTLTTTS